MSLQGRTGGEMGGPRPSLVFVPSDDAGLAEHVQSLVSEPAVAALLDRLDHAALQRRLRERFPRGTVRPREALAQVRPEDHPVWYVSRGRERFRLQASVWIAAPREDVFRVYVDPGSIDLWQEAAGIRAVQASPAIVGTSWQAEYEVLRLRLAGTFRIVKADPPSAVRVEAVGPLRSRLWYVTAFEERNGGTQLDVEGDYELPFQLLTRVPSRLFAEREIERVVAGSHARLKKLLETTFGQPGDEPAAAGDHDGPREDRSPAFGDLVAPPAIRAEVPSSSGG
jgi:hypothetical protein